MPDGSSGLFPRKIENAGQWAEALGEIEGLCLGAVGPAERDRMQGLMRAIRAYEETLIAEVAELQSAR